ncbi:MAG: 50S ribosomal protein L25 [Lachnospiraceae bacterium]|nr:50S ribosomal protein L25 [Lachnospiraceae bacterium]
MDTLKAEKRDLQVKAKKLRREGYVTGNIIGREIEGSIPVKVKAQEAERVFRTKKKGSQLCLDVEGRKMSVLIKEIHYNAMKNQYDEVDFQALVSDEKVHSVAEVVLVNHDKVQEGIIQLVLEEISYRALPSALVEKIEIDVGQMKPGDSVKVADLPIAANPDVDLDTSRDAVVVLVTEARNAGMQEEASEEGSEKSGE